MDVKATPRGEKTTITLEDNQAAFVIDDEGAIQFYVHREDDDTERNLEPHELIVLAFALMYTHDIDRVIDTCQQWLEEVDPQNEIKH